MYKKLISVILLLFIFQNSYAQMGEDFLRSTGKLYAVVAVVIILFLGMIIYLIKLDKKIKKLENKIDNE